MKWRGQGILVAVVLLAAGAFGYQWTSTEKLQDQAFGYGLNYRPYQRLIDDFVERERRWPASGELDLNSVAEGGAITNAELLENGEIRFTFSGWTIKSGYVEAIFAPVVRMHSATGSGSRLQYYCVEVDPPAFEPVVCRSEGKSARAEVVADNVDAFQRWAAAEREEGKRKADMDAARVAAENQSTLCDELWIDAQQSVIPCVEGINPSLAGQIRQRSEKIFNGPRLSTDTIVLNPNALVAFNRECEENWRTLVAMAKINDESIGRCF